MSKQKLALEVAKLTWIIKELLKLLPVTAEINEKLKKMGITR